MAKTENRKRNWTFLIYPDSCPTEQMNKVLSELIIPYVLSPLHDKDVNADGTPKKPHYHLVLLFEGLKSLDNIKEISALFSNVLPIPVQSIRQMIRYLCHLDNPDKAQYSVESIRSCGVDVPDLMCRTGSENRSILRCMLSFISENNIMEFCDFIDVCACDEMSDWFELATERYSLVLKEYIKSKKFKFRESVELNRK